MADGVALRWPAADGASSYEIQRAFGTADIVSRSHVTGTSWTDRAVREGKRYRYRLVSRHQLEMSEPGQPVEIICANR